MKAKYLVLIPLSAVMVSCNNNKMERKIPQYSLASTAVLP